MSLKYSLGIDIGASLTKFGLVDGNNRIKQFEQLPTPKNKKALISLLFKIIEKDRSSIKNIGIGVPGRIDTNNGKVIKTPNLPLVNCPLIKILKQKVSQPIKIENDANCFALAEASEGSGINYQSVVGITLGTGVGGGIILDKKLYRGRGSAGEIGHHIVDREHFYDLEYFSGAKSLGLQGADYQRLAAQARQKQRKALNFWNDLGCVLGLGGLNIIRFLDPEIIVLGGKTAQFFKLFKHSLFKTLKQNYSYSLPKIVQSKLIDQAGIIGATLLFKIKN